MASIDDRIVGMKFDNASFEQKLGETLKSLNKLQQSLDFSNSTRGMNDLSKASSNFNMANMGSAVEGISAKFLALSTIAITALSKITSAAIDSGMRMVKALSVKPIMEGFQEYETNMNSIQTILANTRSEGAKLSDVNGALDKLNEYSDKTIYNFSQMARNIGTFTAAGVKLDDSVNAIKGIANLAAISGSNSEQASTAMYQLSQALAAGKVNLMDWNSVVNAGMGGKVFKEALFETGKAMKTITDVPLGASFEEWEKKGGTFREQMQKGWLTADVLKTTLGAFSGDLDVNQLKLAGFSEAAAQKMVETGKMGQAAATEVKTFTQLMSTVKESVASGWSQTFRTVFGDFEQAKKLFTEINNGIGGMVGKSADARNKVLKDWAELGGRDQLIQGFRNAIQGLGQVLAPIKEVFREFFPPMTGQRLFELTQMFVRFTASLRIGSETANEIKNVFRGVFSIIEIGWTVIKGIASVFGDLFSTFGAAGGGKALSFLSDLGLKIAHLNNFLVGENKIKEFFEAISRAVLDPVKAINTAIHYFMGWIRQFDSFEAVAAPFSNIMGRIGDRFEQFNGVTQKATEQFNKFADVLGSIGRFIGNVLGYIGDALRNLGQALADSIKPGDFDTAVDAVNVGLLGGIILMIRKFMKTVSDLDFTGGILETATNALNGVTDTLKTMQADLKAGILMKIATAVGILTISIVALSLIDSGALTKALTAIAVGFGQLVVVLAIMEKMSIGGMGVKLGVMAGSMILLATAMAILSIAVKNLSSLGWEELAKGLLGVSLMLVAMTTATRLIAADTAGLIRAAAAMIIMAVALNAMALAVKAFAELSFGDLVKGLIGVGVGLGIIVAGMNRMPAGPGLIAAGLAMIAVAAGLRILAEAVQAFGDMSWSEMGKGFVAVAVGLGLIAGAMHLMPPGPQMALAAAGLVGVGVALNLMAAALLVFGSLSFGEIVTGLTALAGTLAILAVALRAMTGTAAGAGAVLVASGALLVLAGVMKILGGMSIGEIVKGLVAMAAALTILGVGAALLTPVIPALYSLASAITLLGVGFALFGVGAMLVAKAFEVLAQAGLVGVNVLIEVIKRLIAVLPELVGTFVKELAELASEFGMVAALIAKTVTVLISHILDGIIELAPKIGKALIAVITSALELMRTVIPDVVATGLAIFLALLRGLRDNMPQIVTTAVELITSFASTLVANAQKLVDSAVELLLAFTTAFSNRAEEITAAGLALLTAFILGIGNNLQMVTDAVGFIITRFIVSAGTHVLRIVRVGADMIISIIRGIGEKSGEIVTAGVNTIIKFIDGLGSNGVKLARAAMDAVIAFANGLSTAIEQKAPALREAGRRLAFAIVDGATGGLASKAGELAKKAASVFSGAVNGVKGLLGMKSPSRVFFGMGEDMIAGSVLAFRRDTSLEASATNLADRTVASFSDTMARISSSLSNMDDFHPVITPVLDLTRVQTASRGLGALLSGSAIVPSVSFDQARLISTTNEMETTLDDTPFQAGPTEIKFEQNNYSPQALTVNDIYRNTKSQIALAKEELNIS